MGFFETMYYVFQNSSNFGVYVMGHGNLTSIEVIELMSLFESNDDLVFLSNHEDESSWAPEEHMVEYHPNCGNRFHEESGHVLRI